MPKFTGEVPEGWAQCQIPTLVLEGRKEWVGVNRSRALHEIVRTFDDFQFRADGQLEGLQVQWDANAAPSDPTIVTCRFAVVCERLAERVQVILAEEVRLSCAQSLSKKNIEEERHDHRSTGSKCARIRACELKVGTETLTPCREIQKLGHWCERLASCEEVVACHNQKAREYQPPPDGIPRGELSPGDAISL